jgi:hypothetical protein
MLISFNTFASSQTVVNRISIFGLIKLSATVFDAFATNGANGGVGYSGVLAIHIDAPDSRSIDLEDFLDVRLLTKYFEGCHYPCTPRFLYNQDAFSIGNPTAVEKRSEHAIRGIPDQICVTPVDIRQYYSSLVPRVPTLKTTCS